MILYSAGLIRKKDVNLEIKTISINEQFRYIQKQQKANPYG